jgi:hypothetical protein
LLPLTVERNEVRGKEGIEDREQQKWIFRRLSECFGLFDQQTRPLGSRFGFRCSPTSYMDKRYYECDLKLDSLAPQRWRAR